MKIEVLNDRQEVVASRTLKPKAKRDAEGTLIETFRADFQDVVGSAIRLTAKNIGLCPPWHGGAGQRAWMFADEVIVN